MAESANFRGILSDVILWLVLGGVIGSVVYYGAFVVPQRHRQVLSLTFEDANEMTRGANVRMMGIDIGYVNDIQVRQDRVDVVIRTLPDAPKIPRGSLATIQFTGLVGSKSIEIIPADGPRQPVEGEGKGQYLDVEEPIRLKDYFDYNIEIAEALREGAENFSDFFGKRKPVEELQHNARTSARVTANAGLHLQNGVARMADFRAKYTASSADFFTFMTHAQKTTEEAVRITDRQVFGPSVFAVLHYAEALFSEGTAVFQDFQSQGGYGEASAKITAVQSQIQKAYESFSGLAPKQKARGMHQKLSRLHALMSRADDFLGQDHSATLSSIRAGIHSFNERLRWLIRHL